MISKKIIVTVLGLAVLTVGVVAGTILTQKNQDIREEAAPATNLSFSPSSVSKNPGQTFTSSVKIVTGTNLVTGVDIELVYNPAVIQLTEIVPTSSLGSFTNSTTGQVVKNEINNTIGKARFIAYTFNRTLGFSGTQNILNIAGNVISTSAAGTYQINYGDLTAIAALNESQNALLNKANLTVNVILPTATPSPSPTPTKSPSSTPTGSPSPTPTKSPSSTPTGSPSPIAYPNWDVDQNGLINIIDIGLIVDDYDNPDPVTPRADVDKNGMINIIDIGIVIDHYN